MDIKQLVTGNPKVGFYPVTQDTITVIELNKAVMNLTNESSSEDIIAAFDNLESFQALIAEVRNPQNICSGILINETPEDKRVGKYEASIIANTNVETLHVRWIEINKIVVLTITNTDGTMSCIRNESNIGGTSVDLSNYLAKDNTTPFTPNADYQPATKKYVDDFMNIYQVESKIAASYNLTTGYVDGISMNGLAYNSIKANIIRVSIIDQDNKKCGDIIIDKNKNSIIYSCGYIKVKEKDKIYGCNVEAYISDNVLYANFAIKECYLKESEYSKYGEVVNTDNILYFVTPDA